MVVDVVAIEPTFESEPRQPHQSAGFIVRQRARPVALDAECFKREVAGIRLRSDSVWRDDRNLYDPSLAERGQTGSDANDPGQGRVVRWRPKRIVLSQIGARSSPGWMHGVRHTQVQA